MRWLVDVAWSMVIAELAFLHHELVVNKWRSLLVVGVCVIASHVINQFNEHGYERKGYWTEFRWKVYGLYLRRRDVPHYKKDDLKHRIPHDIVYFMLLDQRWTSFGVLAFLLSTLVWSTFNFASKTSDTLTWSSILIIIVTGWFGGLAVKHAQGHDRWRVGIVTGRGFALAIAYLHIRWSSEHLHINAPFSNALRLASFLIIAYLTVRSVEGLFLGVPAIASLIRRVLKPPLSITHHERPEWGGNRNYYNNLNKSRAERRRRGDYSD